MEAPKLRAIWNAREENRLEKINKKQYFFLSALYSRSANKVVLIMNYA